MSVVDRHKGLISIVISFFNEEENLVKLISRLDSVFSELESYSYELIFVNDASTDGSLSLLLEEQKLNSSVKIIDMARNFGHMPCMFAGLEASRGIAAVYMDADLQDPPETIPLMIDEWCRDDEVEVVFTTRASRAGESRLRLLLTKLGYKLLRYTSNIEIPPDSGDFKLLSRRALNQYLQFGEKRPFFRFLVSWIGLKQVRVIYDREQRYRGSRKYEASSVVKNFLELALIPFSELPLRVSLTLGFVTSFLAFCYLVYLIVVRFLGMNLPGWTAIMAVVLVSTGIQLIVLGILGLYIGAIYQESINRPRYIIKAKYGID